ncbi:hypothetical protein RHMOL_Rhmol06G0180500 [Rhododendron molle]|uniref:Uncharacterized protein n=1 Tax=Rhododendron molle TaxID=49168 RepID=A0ACC0NDT1_RHOML|nr:hypothetical protein RHMOL_Rhmol06G0180500 [Rhododendron molle]
MLLQDVHFAGQVPILECQGISSRFRHFLKKAVTVAVGVAPQALAMIWVPTNLGGAERLALGIIESESDFYLHSLWGLPNEVCTFCHRTNEENFNILLFHYDGWTSGMPNIFCILGSWQPTIMFLLGMTTLGSGILIQRNKLALLLDTFPFFFKERRCTDPHLPPCAAFVEIMAPVFSRDAWRCVWHMIQHLAAASPPLFSGNDCSFSCSTIPTVGRRKPQPFLAPPRSSIEMPWSIRYPASKGEKLDLEDGGERDLTDSWVTCGLSEEKTNLIDKVSWLDYGHRGMQVWYPSPGVDPFKQEDFLQCLIDSDFRLLSYRPSQLVEQERFPLEEVFEQLRTSRGGLTSEDAEENKILKFLSFMWNPLSWAMEAAAVKAIVLANRGRQGPDWQDLIGIVCLLLINSTISFIEENNAGNAAASLVSRLAPKTKSALTGESLPVTKRTGDEVFSGSTCRHGEIEAVVIATGVHSLFGKAAHLVDSTEVVGHFKQVLTSIGIYSCGDASGNGCDVPYTAFSYRDGINNLLVLLIGGIPIAMPTVCDTCNRLTSTLSAGTVLESYRSGTITKRMTAIEEMAGMDVLCSDKTGTLTLNRLTVDRNFIEYES